MRSQMAVEVWVTAACALAAMAIEYMALPQAVRIVPGLLMIFFLPGFATIRAVLPARDMSGGENLLASVGASVAIAVCASVMLGATIGLSQRSISVVLGGLTVVACLFAWRRAARHWRNTKVK